MKAVKLYRTTIIILCIIALGTLFLCSINPKQFPELSAFFLKGDTEEERQQLEDTIIENVSRYSTSFEIRGYPAELVAETYKNVVSEHPEFFWLTNGYKYTSASIGCIQVSVLFEPILTVAPEDIPEMDSSFKAVLSDILSQVDASAGDYEKALFVHDYIAESCRYYSEFDALLPENGGDLSSCDQIYATAFGCLVNHEAICSGYTAAYRLILTALGIPCGSVHGQAGDSDGTSGHIWNYVVLDGEGYFVDLTWDDAATKEQYCPPDHCYFCVTGDEIFKSHSLDAGQTVPECSSTKYNYHIFNSIYLESYDYAALSALVKEDGVTEIKFSDEKELQRACADLFERNNVFLIPAVASHGSCTVWHKSCPDSCVLVMWID